MALRHHERLVATRSARSHYMYKLTSDTPRLRQPVSRSPVAPRKRTLHQDRANPNGIATSRTLCRHTVCPHTIEAVMRAFRTRRPPKVTRQVSKTSVSYETSSKSHTSWLQNERFVRDFLKNSHVKVCNPSVSYETSSQSQAETPLELFIAEPCQAVSRFQSLQTTPAHTPIPMSRPHDSLRLPRITHRNLTIPCACHENRTSTPQNPHKVLRLPRKVTISSHVSFNKICTTPHVWNDFGPF